MHREAGILQDRVEPAPVERCRIEPKERIGGQQHEGQEADADQRLDAQHAGPEHGRQVAAEHGHRSAEQGEDPHPEDAASPRDCPTCR